MCKTPESILLLKQIPYNNFTLDGSARSWISIVIIRKSNVNSIVWKYFIIHILSCIYNYYRNFHNKQNTKVRLLRLNMFFDIANLRFINAYSLLYKICRILLRIFYLYRCCLRKSSFSGNGKLYLKKWWIDFILVFSSFNFLFIIYL